MATLVDGTKAVAATGTAEKLTTATGAIDWIIIGAHDDNTGQMLVGTSTVVGAGGATARGARIPIPAATLNEVITLRGPLSLADLYADCEVNGDGVSFLYKTID